VSLEHGGSQPPTAADPNANRGIRFIPVARAGRRRQITPEFHPHETPASRTFAPSLNDDRPVSLAVHRIRLRAVGDLCGARMVEGPPGGDENPAEHVAKLLLRGQLASYFSTAPRP
jgi:hypothetical protein